MMIDTGELKISCKPPAVVCPVDDHMGLDIARILYQSGISVFGIDYNYDIPGRFSRCLKYIHCPYPESKRQALIGFLIKFGKSVGEKAILYPLSDDHVFAISEFREELSRYFAFVLPNHLLVEKLINKDGLYSLAHLFSIPAPKTFFVWDMLSFNSAIDAVNFPAIIKPEESAYWYSEKATSILRKGLLAGRPKVIYCKNRKELEEAYKKISKIDNRVVVQEVIPGEDHNLVYVAFYCDRQSDVIGYFSGRKYRVLPKGFGSASYVKSFDDPELRSIVSKFLKDIGYQGLGGIEFKKDIRDGVYKIIEFNPRFGMWDGLSVRCGVNLPYIAYCDAMGRPVEKQLKFRENVIWVDWQRDLRAFFEYRRAGELTLRQWWQSLRGEKVFPIYSRWDWKPGIYFTFLLLIRFWRRVRGELLKR